MPRLTLMADQLPTELARRIEALEREGGEGDLNLRSWFWLISLGVATPAALLLWGWWA